MCWSRGGWALQDLGSRLTCPVFHVLHLHDFSVDAAPEDVEGAVDGFGPLGGFLPPGDPERQWEVIPYASPHGGSTVFHRAEGERVVTWTSAQGWEGSGTWVLGWQVGDFSTPGHSCFISKMA